MKRAQKLRNACIANDISIDAVAKHVNMDGEELIAEIENGGLMLFEAEAIRNFINGTNGMYKIEDLF